MQAIFEAAQPYLSAVVTALIGALVAVLLAGVALVRTKIVAWLTAKTSAEQRALLHRLASEGFAYAETVFNGDVAQTKLQEALGYVSRRLAAAGIEYSPAEIRAAVEKAVLDYNTKSKPPDSASISVKL